MAKQGFKLDPLMLMIVLLCLQTMLAGGLAAVGVWGLAAPPDVIDIRLSNQVFFSMPFGNAILVIPLAALIIGLAIAKLRVWDRPSLKHPVLIIGSFGLLWISLAGAQAYLLSSGSLP